jgi:hypothetical protein
LSNFESGLAYPPARHIAKLNELGANIRPSIFSRLAQLLTAALKRNLTDARIHKMAHLWGVQITEHDRLWTKEQLLKKGLRYIDVARKAGGIALYRL